MNNQLILTKIRLHNHMAIFKNTMEVFQLLKKTNCKKCNKQTCLAFAAEVFQGRARLSDCPYIDAQIIQKYNNQKNTTKVQPDHAYQNRINALKTKILKIDLAGKACQLGGKYNNNKLTLKILGKDFSVDSKGNISTDIHVNSWIVPVVYSYIINSPGVALSNQWISFRELKDAIDWYNFFQHQCIKTLKQIADTHTNFFRNIIELFNGRQVKNHYKADISLIIHPLPKLPILFCYNKPEEDLESDLNLFFDSTTDINFDAKDVYTIIAGLTKMFEKLSITHG